MEERQNRINSVDLFRAFGILVMIMGHVGFGGLFHKWSHAFHMPMFFFISGWFYKQEASLQGRLLRKAKGLLVPYLLIGAAEFLCLIPFFEEYRGWKFFYSWLVENTDPISVELGARAYSPVPGAMWFLTSLFLCEAVYAILDRYAGDSFLLHILVLGGAVFGMMGRTVFSFRFPWALDAGLVGMGFYHIARVWKKTGSYRLLELKAWQSLLSGVFFSILIIFSPWINMRRGGYGIYPLFVCNAMGAIAAGWNLSRHFGEFCSRNRLLSWFSSYLSDIGRNSIVYLCLNQIVIMGIDILLAGTGIGFEQSKIVCLILTMGVLFLLEKGICNTRLRFLVGRF